MYEVVFEDPFDKPHAVVDVEPLPQGDILRMNMGQRIACECGRCEVDREGDHYKVKGPMYHTKDTGSEWLVCPHCNDRIKIHPVVDYMDAPDPKGIRE